MLKIIIFILVIGVLYVLWRMVAKHKINAAFDQQRQDLSQIVQHDDELPEKTKIIKQMIDEERQKAVVESVDSSQDSAGSTIEHQITEVEVSDEDQRLFDSAAEMFFSQALRVRDFLQAEKIQQELLSKMPMNTESQVGAFDFGEWSVFWHYHDQSLEYYVGRYGIFYAHVDREGIEHKAEFKDVI